MAYSVEKVNYPFGEGTRISRDSESYEQVKARDDLTVLISKSHRGYFDGKIYRPTMTDSEADYRLFKELTDNARVNIDNSQQAYLNYVINGVSSSSYPKVKITIEDKLDPEKGYGILVEKYSRIAGSAADVIVFGAIIKSFPLALSLDSLIPLCIFGIGCYLGEEVIGDIVGKKLNSQNVWCGPIHALGYVPVKKLTTTFFRKHQDYFIDKFAGILSGYDKIQIGQGNAKRLKRLGNQLDRYYSLINNDTTQFKGFSISYREQDKDQLIDKICQTLGVQGQAQPIPSQGAQPAQQPAPLVVPIPTPQDAAQPTKPNHIPIPWDYQIEEPELEERLKHVLSQR